MKVVRPTTLRSVLVYCDLRGVAMFGIIGMVCGVVVRVRCIGLVRSCVRRRDVDCLSGAASEE